MSKTITPKQKALNEIIRICKDQNSLTKSMWGKNQIYEIEKKRFETRNAELNHRLNEQFEILQNIFDWQDSQISLF